MIGRQTLAGRLALTTKPRSCTGALGHHHFYFLPLPLALQLPSPLSGTWPFVSRKDQR